MSLFQTVAELLNEQRTEEAMRLFEGDPPGLANERGQSLRAVGLARLGQYEAALAIINRVCARSRDAAVKPAVRQVFAVFRERAPILAPLPLPAPLAPSRRGVIVFSKDRPLQLEALLRGLHDLTTAADAGPIHVLHLASAPLFERGYELLQASFPDVRFVREQRFDEDLRRILDGLDCVTFLVDDAVFYRPFDWRAAYETVEGRGDILGFSLRLGLNLSRSIRSALPPFAWPETTPLGRSGELPGGGPEDEILALAWSRHPKNLDLHTPLEVSSSCFRTATVLALLDGQEIANPNMLELTLDAQKSRLRERPVAFFRKSVSYCLPVNAVQDMFSNLVMQDDDYTPAALGQHFLDGFRFNLEDLRFYTPASTHEYFYPGLVRKKRPA
jgi:hypothetical protein